MTPLNGFGYICGIRYWLLSLNNKKNTLIDSVNYARKYVEITEEQYDTILAFRKTVLKNKRSTWVKSGSDNFDVPMGGYDSLQIADFVGLYILDILRRIVSPEQMGL